MTLEEKIKKLPTKKRGNCPDCGNPWWFEHEHNWECTTCSKVIGKSSAGL